MIGTGCRSAMVTQHDPSVLPPSDRERRREGHCQPIRPNLHCCPQVTSAPQSPKLPLASSPSQAGAYSTGDRARFGDAVPGLPATSTERKRCDRGRPSPRELIFHTSLNFRDQLLRLLLQDSHVFCPLRGTDSAETRLTI